MKDILVAIFFAAGCAGCGSTSSQKDTTRLAQQFGGSWEILEVKPDGHYNLDSSRFGAFMINMAASTGGGIFVYRDDTLFFDKNPKATYKVTTDSVYFDLLADNSKLICPYKLYSDTLQLVNFPEGGFTSTFIRR